MIDEESVTTVSIVTATVGIVAHALVLFAYFRYRSLQKVSAKLIVLQSLADLIVDLAYAVIPSKQSHALCQLQAFVIESMGLSSVLWAFVMAFVLIRMSSKGQSKYHPQDHLWKYYILCFVLPVLVAVIPLVTGKINL